MTIAVTIKVNDGIILAADSASSMMDNDSIVNIYNNGNKIFNLHKMLPVELGDQLILLQ